MATAEQTTSLGERVSRIEGGYEHLATKADLAQLKAELQSDIAGLHGDIERTATLVDCVVRLMRFAAKFAA